MKTKLFLVLTLFSVFSVCTFSAENATNAMPASWIQPNNMQFTAGIKAQVFKNGVLYEPVGLTIAVFKNGVCRGVKNRLTQVGAIKMFIMAYASNFETESGFTAKMWDPTDNTTYDLVETINFTNSVSLGLTLVPFAYNIKYTNVIVDQTASTIPDAANADVIVGTAGKITVDANATLRSVELKSSGKLDLPIGRTLNVTGNLVLKSGSTFVDLNPAGGLTVGGTTTIQQNLTGAGGATPNGRFWYVGTPVTGVTSAVFDAAGSNQLWYYDEPTHAYVEITDNTTALQAGRGYVVLLGSNATINFTGALISGAKTFTLTNTPGNEKSGYNLVYNPYPSFIRWIDAASLPGNVLPSIWTRTATSSGAMAFDSYNTALGAGVSGSGSTATRYIAPYQAFWVKYTGAGSITLPLDNSMRTLVDVDYTSSVLKAKAAGSTQLLRLMVSDGTEVDETLIAFNSNATNNVDNYDTPKMSNDTFKIPEIYTTINSEKYAINSFNTVNDLDLGFTTEKAASKFTIKATEISNFDSDIMVVLVDKLDNKETELNVNTEYEFSSGVTATNTRFTVKFKSKNGITSSGIDSNNLPYTLVRTSNNGYELNILNSKLASVKVYNTVGQLIQNFSNISGNKTIGGNLPAGIYTVVVKIDGLQSISKKLSIK